MKIDIGSGNNPQKGCITVDKYTKADIKDDITTMSKFRNGSVDHVSTYHLLEHLPDKQVPLAIKQVHRVLRQGGRWIIQVPDLEWVLKSFLETPEDDPDKWVWKLHTIFGHQKHEGEYHKTGFSVKRLEHMLTSAGFKISFIESKYSEDYRQNCITSIAIKA